MSLSGGEIGSEFQLREPFLINSSVLVLDEPTSNLDEGQRTRDHGGIDETQNASDDIRDYASLSPAPSL